MSTTPWSQYQNDIFKAVADLHESLDIRAVAGSGKTTTIVEAINHVPRDQQVCFLAFNKSIAAELGRRITAPNAICRTLHAAGLAAWKGHLAWDAQNLEVNGNKMRDIMDEVLSDSERWTFGGQLGKLIGMAKGAGLVPQSHAGKCAEGIVEDSNSAWEDMIEFYDLDPDKCSIPLARRLLGLSIDHARDVVDFDDMLYMPVVAGAAFEAYNVVFLDEAQDVNALQVEMVARMVAAKAGRVIAVGDPHQSIYGFRGCVADSMDVIARRFHAASLPLSVSYRCPKRVVKHAREFVSHIEPAETSPEGVVETPQQWSLGQFQPQDAVLCRITRPIVDLAFRLIRARIPAMVIGRDIGANLVNLVKKMKASSVEDLGKKLAKYHDRERTRMLDNGKDTQAALLDDKMDTLGVFIEGLAPGEEISDLIASIESMFGEAGQAPRAVVLSTVHKAKGLEWERVFILDADKFMPVPWAKQGWQQEQEVNLMYVAATRSKRELRYLSSETIFTQAAAAAGETAEAAW